VWPAIKARPQHSSVATLRNLSLHKLDTHAQEAFNLEKLYCETTLSSISRLNIDDGDYKRQDLPGISDRTSEIAYDPSDCMERSV
jgi:hypothetical protein